MRCAAGDAPLLAVNGRRYLGGAYAVRLAKLPKGARSLGVGADGQVWWSPKTGLLAVEKDGKLWRWLTLPARQAAGKPAVHFLGDSVMLGAHSAIERAFGHWDLTFDARESRSTTDGLVIVQRWRSSIRDAIVIQLGTNDGGIPSYYRIHVDNILDSLRGVPLVVWLTMAHARAYYAVDDRVIRSELSTHPNTVLGDWNAALPDGGAYGDGLHLTPTGAAAMARLTRRILGPWRMARAGAGPASCADAVLGSA
jgi:hypothetical protein